MPQIRKVLFPVDYSDNCRETARYVEALARRFEAEVLMVHVVVTGEYHLSERLMDARRTELEAFLRDELRHLRTERLCVIGAPATSLLEVAEHWHPDLVMMPTHGMGLFRRLLLGSVTSKILQAMPCPVWTSVHTEQIPALNDIHCRRILCALDSGEHDNQILEWSAWLANQYRAELGILHATPQYQHPFTILNRTPEAQQLLSAEAKRHIHNLQTAAGTKAPVFLEFGEAGEVTERVARDFGADLILIGRHSEKIPGGQLRRNATAILRSAPCPVISI